MLVNKGKRKKRKSGEHMVLALHSTKSTFSINWSQDWSSSSAGYYKNAQNMAKNALLVFVSSQKQLIQQLAQRDSSCWFEQRIGKFEIQLSRAVALDSGVFHWNFRGAKSILLFLDPMTKYLA